MGKSVAAEKQPRFEDNPHALLELLRSTSLSSNVFLLRCPQNISRKRAGGRPWSADSYPRLPRRADQRRRRVRQRLQCCFILPISLCH